MPVSWHLVDRNQVERAVPDVLLEAVKDERYTAGAMKERAGITPRTWSNYFTSHTSPVPIGAVWAIGDVLGIPGSELMRRAEERARALEGDPLVPRTASGRAAVEEGRKKVHAAEKPKPKRATRRTG